MVVENESIVGNNSVVENNLVVDENNLVVDENGEIVRDCKIQMMIEEFRSNVVDNYRLVDGYYHGRNYSYSNIVEDVENCL